MALVATLERWRVMVVVVLFLSAGGLWQSGRTKAGIAPTVAMMFCVLTLSQSNIDMHVVRAQCKDPEVALLFLASFNLLIVDTRAGLYENSFVSPISHTVAVFLICMSNLLYEAIKRRSRFLSLAFPAT